MAIHLVRHAHAGSAHDWREADDLRPLTERGVAQAQRLVERLAGRPIDRVVSSRYRRCVQTVTPLADARGLAVDTDRRLAEETSITDAWAVVEEAIASSQDVVLCSHGNVISPLLDRLHRRGTELVAAELSCRTGSIWTVELDGRDIARVVQTHRG